MKQAVAGSPTKEDIEFISRYCRETPDTNNIYVFTVSLCDNEIDSDYERFSMEALYALKDMFKGVSGIFDYSMKSSDQKARIYKTDVISDPSRKTAAGEDYTYLKAWCYMLRTPNNQELIKEIDGGIKKEVSISCVVDSCICSVCGKDMRGSECSHKTGSTVNGKLCHCILSFPTDVYEWSFVEKPVQKSEFYYNYYFTFGSWEKFPFKNGYIIIKACSLSCAKRVFNVLYPNEQNESVLLCSDYYTEDQWARASENHKMKYYGTISTELINEEKR